MLPDCFDHAEAAACNASGLAYYDRQCVNVTGQPGLAANISAFWAAADANETKESPARQYLQ